MVLSPKAHHYLADMMKPYGEFLPILLENDEKPHYIFNCLTLAEVDKKQSSQSEEKTAFLEEDIGDKLFFKIRYQSCLDIFCTGQVKEQIESLRLTGIIFDDKLYTPFV